MTDGSGRNHMKYDLAEPTVWAICPDGRLFFALQEGVNGAQADLELRGVSSGFAEKEEIVWHGTDPFLGIHGACGRTRDPHGDFFYRAAACGAGIAIIRIRGSSAEGGPWNLRRRL